MISNIDCYGSWKSNIVYNKIIMSINSLRCEILRLQETYIFSDVVFIFIIYLFFLEWCNYLSFTNTKYSLSKHRSISNISSLITKYNNIFRFITNILKKITWSIIMIFNRIIMSIIAKTYLIIICVK